MKNSIFLTLTVLLAAFFVSTAIADPGDTLWTRTYGGSGLDQGQSVQQTTDGGYIVAAYTASFGAGSNDFWLLKTDANGDTLWTRIYGGSSNDFSRCVQQTTDGGYIIAGTTYTFGAGVCDAWLLKTDANGDTLWTRTYGGTNEDRAESVEQTTDGGYIVVGYTKSFGAGLYDFYLVKTDANGGTLWCRRYGGSGAEWSFSVQETTDGGYILAGYTTSFGAGNEEVYLVKTDANGYLLWTRTYGGSGNDQGRCVQQTTDGGYIIAGHTMSFGAGSYDFYLLKTDANGDTLWMRTYGGTGSDRAESVQQTSDGGYIMTGYTNSFGAGSGDVYLVRVAGEALEPDVSIEITPDDPPVTVPRGGSFGFTGTLTNNTEDPQMVDAWTMAIGPLEGVYGPFKSFEDLRLAPSQTRSDHFNQHVPNLAPLGFYNYIAYCGDYPSTVMDSSFFQIEVVEGVGSSQVGWVLTGSFLEGNLSDLPSEFTLSGNYPNPFNARTVISYQLAVESSVRLEIYNLLGNKVATLVDGKQEAGYKSVTWDDSEVSSGIYFYKLTAGDYTEVKRMTLLR